jgi:protocatechuate 3,4-dioxygenase beta subunit
VTSFRRRLILGALALPLAGRAFGQSAPPTPGCGAQTPRQTEGPFFKTDSPKRTSLVESGSKAPRFLVTGRVLSRECRPVANALLDFWHADEEGAYDNHGWRYRGHQFSDGAGRYRLETIVPAEYPGRTRHIHVKVQAPGKRVLATQLYFPDEPGNRRDGLYRPALEMRAPKTGEGAFDFVVEA